MISKILLCSLAFSSIVRLIDRTGLPTWLNENGPPAVYTLTRVHFQYFKYTEFYFFYESFDTVWNHVSSAALLLVAQQHLPRPRFLWITPSLIIPLKKRKFIFTFTSFIFTIQPQIASVIVYSLMTNNRLRKIRRVSIPISTRYVRKSTRIFSTLVCINSFLLIRRILHLISSSHWLT